MNARTSEELTHGKVNDFSKLDAVIELMEKSENNGGINALIADVQNFITSLGSMSKREFEKIVLQIQNQVLSFIDEIESQIDSYSELTEELSLKAKQKKVSFLKDVNKLTEDLLEHINTKSMTEMLTQLLKMTLTKPLAMLGLMNLFQSQKSDDVSIRNSGAVKS